MVRETVWEGGCGFRRGRRFGGCRKIYNLQAEAELYSRLRLHYHDAIASEQVRCIRHPSEAVSVGSRSATRSDEAEHRGAIEARGRGAG
jgi:hypothetical protein